MLLFLEAAGTKPSENLEESVAFLLSLTPGQLRRSRAQSPQPLSTNEFQLSTLRQRDRGGTAWRSAVLKNHEISCFLKIIQYAN